MSTIRGSREASQSRDGNLTLVAHLHPQHSLQCVRAGLTKASHTFALSLRGIFRSYNTPVNSLRLDHAACTRRSKFLSMVPSVSITDPRHFKRSAFFSSSPFSFIFNRVSLVDRCFVFATLIFRPLAVKTFCHDSSLFWVSVFVMLIIARASAYRSCHVSSDRTS